ncbi:sulfatase-like hydrolase/transferase [Flavilitoribacter nigricans]|uniref:N-acetylgalactosamine 6-sulfate sulfatase n=1 Tax=Flavilitoribacter nigricans (strain ATCC 23147 / DSM 23189 / NBRC 102662 / NCIMB 1420 / SS-2) TaxID=1122177 RepID=A0A2D0N1G5_FLAN2|nr:sulfatase-like hydrolase/transferase [Flavilitoribacter nigricans]PHN02371.1 N-acetylgalactosamine 6-sulfate sulfatase [Flavilitoribacter nigricans DSM 23189 = NBRC 102662]
MSKNYLLFLLLGLFSCRQGAEQEQAQQRPNILFILVDDLGKEWVSAYGAEDIQTPHIDALAASGTTFRHAYSMPQCTPSRVTLLTGQYPFRHGWVNHWDVPRWGGGAHFDERRNPALPVKIREAGYKTCMAGKWQIDDFRVEPDALVKSGFDAYCMWTGYEAEVPVSAERYQDPYIYQSGASKTYEGQFGPDIFKDFIIDFIHTNKDDPWLVYYPMVLTHTPFVNTPDETADDNLGKHKAMVRYTDKITGELMAALEKEGQRDNTLIIWTTDNGTARQIEGHYRGNVVQGGKSQTTEPGICAPFIASWPGVVRAGHSSEALIDFTDLFPTFLSLAGAPIGPEIEMNGEQYIIDGRSFADVLLGKQTNSARPWILGMGGGNNAKRTEAGVENQYVYRDRVLRNERFKLFVGPDQQAAGFYDLQRDPWEQQNLIDQTLTDTAQRALNTLLEAASDFPEEDADPRYIPNPEQSWDVPITAESGVWKRTE